MHVSILLLLQIRQYSWLDTGHVNSVFIFWWRHARYGNVSGGLRCFWNVNMNIEALQQFWPLCRVSLSFFGFLLKTCRTFEGFLCAPHLWTPSAPLSSTSPISCCNVLEPVSFCWFSTVLIPLGVPNPKLRVHSRNNHRHILCMHRVLRDLFLYYCLRVNLSR